MNEKFKEQVVFQIRGKDIDTQIERLRGGQPFPHAVNRSADDVSREKSTQSHGLDPRNERVRRNRPHFVMRPAG
ncbi:hypothetical protein D3C86_1897150 [compost metagenome]